MGSHHSHCKSWQWTGHYRAAGCCVPSLNVLGGFLRGVWPPLCAGNPHDAACGWVFVIKRGNLFRPSCAMSTSVCHLPAVLLTVLCVVHLLSLQPSSSVCSCPSCPTHAQHANTHCWWHGHRATAAPCVEPSKPSKEPSVLTCYMPRWPARPAAWCSNEQWSQSTPGPQPQPPAAAPAAACCCASSAWSCHQLPPRLQ